MYRASVVVGTGSTSCRSLARLRRRMERSTSASHHSWPTPPGRNSPVTTRPVPTSRWMVVVTTATPSPSRSATSAGTNGPCVRAYRPTRSPSGSATGSVKASGTPTGRAVPSASRNRPASSIAV